MKADRRDGVFVPLPDSIRDFDWYTLVSPAKRASYDRDTAEKIDKDILPDNGCVKRHHVVRRMNKLGYEMEDPQYKLVKDQLELMRDTWTKLINNWLVAFILNAANAILMIYKNRPISTWDEYLDWVQHNVNSKADAMFVIKSLYLSFQHQPDYRSTIRDALLVEQNKKFPRRHIGRPRRSFCEKLISHRQNALRRQVCTRSSKFTGYKYRVIRKKFHGQINRERNFPQYYFPWMITWKPPTYIPKKKDDQLQIIVQNRSGNVVTVRIKRTNHHKL